MPAINPKLRLLLLPLAFASLLAACDNQGPAEKLGQNMDEVLERDGDVTDGTLEDLGEDIDRSNDQ